MSVLCACTGCGDWLHPNATELCVDCGENLCHRCAVVTHHRVVHEDATPDEAESMPNGWDYLRCGDTPYSIHDEEV